MTTAIEARVPASALFALHRTAARDRSAAEAATFLRQIGYGMGEAVFVHFRDWLGQVDPGTQGSGMPAERFWELFTRFWEEELGWGTLRHEELHPGVAALDSEDWAEAVTPEATGCHLTTGLLAELLRFLAGTDAAVLEVECRSRGDFRCRFLFGNPAILEQLYGDVRSGASYGAAIQRLA